MKRLTFLLILLGLTACGDFFSEKESDPVAILSEDEPCFDVLFEKQFAYFRGEIGLRAAEASVDCAIDDLQTLQTVLKGSPQENGMTQIEVADLITNLFFKDDPIPRKLIFEAVTMKSWFIGGFENFVSGDELAQAIFLFQEWRAFLGRIEPLIPDLNLQKGQGTEEQMRQAQAQLIEEFAQFYQHLSDTIDPFDITVVERFFHELKEYTQGDDYSIYIKLFHGITWLINNAEDKVDTPKTLKAYLIFYNEYMVLNYKTDLTVEDLTNNTDAYLEWLPDAVSAINEAMGEDYVLNFEALKLIGEFLAVEFTNE